MAGKWQGKKVAVLMGGVTKEREISLRTGTAVAQALKRRGYDIVPIDLGIGTEAIQQIQKTRPDVAVIALHGKFGEDGCVQGLLEMMRIPYTGGGVLASSAGMDKVVTNRIARELGIPCPEEVVFDTDKAKTTPSPLRGEGEGGGDRDGLDHPPPYPLPSREGGEKVMPLDLPVIVKPSREGSTINMTIVREISGLEPAIRKASESDTKVIIERYIEGKEVTVGVINGRILPPLEIAPKSGFYDYTSKYTKGMTEYIVPARIDNEVTARLERWTAAIYREIECEGTARCDYIVAPNNEAYFLEINTIPGMTELSLVPKAAAHIGIDFDELCEALLGGARLKVNV